MIQFRDRALKEGEKSHWYCDKCGVELNSDFKDRHKCNEIIKEINVCPIVDKIIRRNRKVLENL